MLSSDYIIVGGGLTGTALAVRLSEDPSVSVTIIEAGSENFHSDAIDTPAKSFNNIGNPAIDWVFLSTPQKNLNGRQVYLPRGKGLGGSSLLNLMFVNRAPSVEYDGELQRAFAKLGMEGWSWKDLLPYFRKSETFTYNEEDAKRYGMKFDEHYYGTSGPVQRTVPRSLDIAALPWIKAFEEELKIKINPDPNGGDNTGVYVNTKTLDGRSIRSSSASAYYEPNRSRSNLKVISNALATRVILSGTGPVIATGVEFLQDNSLQVIHANKEVILCCGTFKTPHILELSGIGNPKVLEPVGIPVIVDLPGVGNNLQVRDHPCVFYTAKLKKGHDSYERMSEDPEFCKVQEEMFNETGTGMLVSSGIPTAAAFVSFKDLDRDGTISQSLESVQLPDTPALKTQMEWVKNENVAFVEFNTLDKYPASLGSPEHGSRYQTSGIILMHSFDRGSVHIKSNDPTAPPSIELNVLSNETDLKILVQGFKILRTIHKSKLLESFIDHEVLPGENVEGDEALAEYIRKTLFLAFHPIGTASMLPLKDGGCVDNQLKVYGTTNLRIVDASILPLHLSTHLQATLYAFAEKAADMIKSGALKQV